MPLVLGLARHPEVFIAGQIQRAGREGTLVFLSIPPGTLTRPHTGVWNIYPILGAQPWGERWEERGPRREHLCCPETDRGRKKDKL